MLKELLKKPFEIDIIEDDIPAIADDQVLVKVSSLGICGSDIQVYTGKHKYNKFPLVQGHEASGTIVEVGKAVSGLSVGDKVTVQPQIFCGECEPCRRGHINVCENLKVLGIHVDGLACEYAAVDASMIVKLPEAMDFDFGAMIEPVSVGLGALRRCGNIEGRNVVVIGAGTIGNILAQCANALGAGNLIITDVNENRLNIAERCGIKNCINTMKTPLKEAIDNCFGSDGADIIVDCAAVPAALREAIGAARPASTIAIVGNYKEEVSFEMPLIQRQQIDMLGIMMYVREDFEKAIQLIENKKIDLSPLVTNHFSIHEYSEAYEYIKNNPDTVMKVIIKIS